MVVPIKVKVFLSQDSSSSEVVETKYDNKMKENKPDIYVMS